MKKILSFESAIFVVISLISLALIYFHFDIKRLQQIVAVLLFILLIFSNSFTKLQKNETTAKLARRGFLILSTLFVQLIVISTGGLKSPFLVLVHLFTLGVSFLVGVAPALVFLGLTLLTIMANFWLDKTIQSLFLDDPGSVLLYLVSFIVIIPLSILLTKYYYLKDAVAKIMSQEVKLKEMREKVLLQGLNELVLITDKKLNIISANEAAEKLLSSTSSMIVKRSIFDVMFLKDESGKMLTDTDISLDNIISQKESTKLEGLSLFTKNAALPRKVSLQVRPIVNLEGAVEQLSFVVSDNLKSFSSNKAEHNLENAQVKHQAMFEELKEKLAAQNLTDLSVRAEILERVEQDIFSLVEMEDHLIGGKPQPIDVAEFCKRRMKAETTFAKELGVELNFNLINFDNKDTAPLVPKGVVIEPINLTAPFFTAPVDSKWFDVLVQKLLNMAILLSSGVDKPKVELSIDRVGSDMLVIYVVGNSRGFSPQEQQLLFTQYYGLLGNITNLRFGSGLEGYIAQTIATALSIPLEIESDIERVGLTFKLKIKKIVPVTS